MKEHTFCPRCGRRIGDPAAHMRASGQCGGERNTRTRDQAPRDLLWADSRRW